MRRRFLPRVRRPGDILASHGYQSEFIVGADARFAGTSAFCASHGVSEQYAMERIAGLFPAAEVEAAQTGWVLDDRMVLDVAERRFDAVLAVEAPLFLVVETIGPHGGAGYLSRDCAPDGRAGQTRNWSLVVECLAQQSEDFVTAIRAAHDASGRPNPLRIVVQSDQLNHARDLIAGPAELNRNTVIFVGDTAAAHLPARGLVDTPGAMIDVYPSLLEWLGFAGPGAQAGLGRSLFPAKEDAGAEPTMVARFGNEMVDRALIADGDFFDGLRAGSE